MEGIAVVASLKPGTEERARSLVDSGPPFDPVAADLVRHAVYLSTDEVVFVFEGPDVERRMHDLVTAPSQSELAGALDEWQDIVAAPARIARLAFSWGESAEPRSPEAGDGGP